MALARHKGYEPFPHILLVFRHRGCPECHSDPAMEVLSSQENERRWEGRNINGAFLFVSSPRNIKLVRRTGRREIALCLYCYPFFAARWSNPTNEASIKDTSQTPVLSGVFLGRGRGGLGHWVMEGGNEVDYRLWICLFMCWKEDVRGNRKALGESGNPVIGKSTVICLERDF